jgi:hypothetical protein
LNLEERLEELSALVAVAMNVAPEQFPSWSDGSTAHMAALAELWGEVRPHLKMDVAKSLDQKIQQMFAAFNGGETGRGMRIAESLYSNLTDLR